MNNNLEQIEKFESIEIIIHIFYLHIYLCRGAGAGGARVTIVPPNISCNIQGAS